MKRLLYTSAAVRQAIIRLFRSAKGRRVAIAAFVGDGAEAYLPRPEGLELICWPKAGGTNPNVLRKLMKRGVQVFFADRLHMKLYWSENKGAVVTSANLSTNALGSGNLKEVGVLLQRDELDIDHVIHSLKIEPASESVLRKLDGLHKSYVKRNKASLKIGGRIGSYREWYGLPMRPEWKLGWWESTGKLASAAKEKSKKEYGVAAPEDFISARRRDYREADWILTFKLKAKPSELDWLFADYIISVPPSEGAYDEGYPFQAVQVWSKKIYPSPPFSLGKRFKGAFSKAVLEFGPLRIKKLKSGKPPKRLIDLIHKNF